MWNMRTLLLTLVLALMVAGGAAQAAESLQYASGVNEARLETSYYFDYTTSSARSGGFAKTLTRSIGPGFKLVDVELLGWSLVVMRANTPFGEDRHLAVSEIKITDVSYDPVSGRVSFQVSGIFRDKDFDDHIGWRVDYAILALR